MRYDVAIIGAGWAGFNAARLAHAAGKKVVLIEPGPLGGTCLNRGCIPTKALIQSAKVFSTVKKAHTFGIQTCAPVISFSAVQSRKDRIVQKLAQGLAYLLKQIEVVPSPGIFLDAHTMDASGRKIEAEYFIIATGSRPMSFPALPFDGSRIISSDDALSLTELPGSLLAVGGGVVGCEFASLFSVMGTKVTLVEKMPQLLPGQDAEAARKLEVLFRKKGITVHCNADVSAFDLSQYDKVLVCVGRAPNIEGLGLDAAGVKVEHGHVAVDGFLRTSVPHIFAAGDCASLIKLAHFAAYQGETAAFNAAHPDTMRKADNLSVPSAIFTDPEVASVGMLEEEARAKGIDCAVKKFDFLGSGMARILDEAEGFIKVVADSKDGRVLGAVIVGPRATELAATLTVAVTHHLRIEQLKDTIFAHPTLSEGILDALRG